MIWGLIPSLGTRTLWAAAGLLVDSRRVQCPHWLYAYIKNADFGLQTNSLSLYV